MSEENVLLLETKDRELGFLAYDACCDQGGNYLSIEMKMVGDTLKVYVVPNYATHDLQEGPQAAYDYSVTKLTSLVKGIEIGFKRTN